MQKGIEFDSVLVWRLDLIINAIAKLIAVKNEYPGSHSRVLMFNVLLNIPS